MRLYCTMLCFFMKRPLRALCTMLFISELRRARRSCCDALGLHVFMRRISGALALLALSEATLCAPFSKLNECFGRTKTAHETVFRPLSELSSYVGRNRMPSNIIHLCRHQSVIVDAVTVLAHMERCAVFFVSDNTVNSVF